jgi:hypothetical protein
MCSLKIKIRVTGKKNQEFIRFILVPKNVRQKGKYKTSLGNWDIRQNTNLRYIVFNIYKMMLYYAGGATANKTTLHQIYYYFVDLKNLNDWFYFKDNQILLFVENEIKKKYL